MSLGKIHRLEIQNFKSYKGSQIIGPFAGFTAIIGPNGAGKSNLMDDICFVLGVRTTHLRGSQLKDLIYAAFDDSEKQKNERSSLVRLVYQLADKSEIQFARTITATGAASQYFIDGNVVTWDVYNAKLISLDILVKACNFLVFQGYVESIASKSPKELTLLFEQISGSDQFKREYDKLEEEKNSAEEKLKLVYQKKKTIFMEKKKKKEQKKKAEEHLRLQDELKSMKREHFLWKLFNIENDFAKTTEELEVDKTSCEGVGKEVEKFEHEANEEEKELTRCVEKIKLLEKKITEKSNKLDDKTRPDVIKLKEGISRINLKIEKTKKELSKKGEERKRHANDIAMLQRSFQDLEAKMDDVQEKSRNVGVEKGRDGNDLEEYSRIKEEVRIKTANLRERKEFLDGQQRADSDAQTNSEENLQQLKNRELELDSKEKQMRERLDNFAKNKDDLENTKRELCVLQEKQSDFKREYDDLKKKIGDVVNELHELKSDRYENERDAKFADTVATLKRLFQGVHGRMTDLCRPTQKKYNLAITVAMGKLMSSPDIYSSTVYLCEANNRKITLVRRYHKTGF